MNPILLYTTAGVAKQVEAKGLNQAQLVVRGELPQTGTLTLDYKGKEFTIEVNDLNDHGGSAWFTKQSNQAAFEAVFTTLAANAGAAIECEVTSFEEKDFSAKGVHVADLEINF